MTHSDDHRMFAHPATSAGQPDPKAQTDALAELHTRLSDTIKGYDKVLEKAEPEFRRIAADFHTLHVRQSANVQDMLIGDGHDPSGDGSIFGTVNRAVVEVRSWFDEISTNIMDALVSGEKHVLDAYDEALATVTDAGRLRILTEDREALVELLDRHAGNGGR